jgi:hypothetical protein
VYSKTASQTRKKCRQTGKGKAQIARSKGSRWNEYAWEEEEAVAEGLAGASSY